MYSDTWRLSRRHQDLARAAGTNPLWIEAAAFDTERRAYDQPQPAGSNTRTGDAGLDAPACANQVTEHQAEGTLLGSGETGEQPGFDARERTGDLGLERTTGLGRLRKASAAVPRICASDHQASLLQPVEQRS